MSNKKIKELTSLSQIKSSDSVAIQMGNTTYQGRVSQLSEFILKDVLKRLDALESGTGSAQAYFFIHDEGKFLPDLGNINNHISATRGKTDKGFANYTFKNNSNRNYVISAIHGTADEFKNGICNKIVAKGIWLSPGKTHELHVPKTTAKSSTARGGEFIVAMKV